MFLSALAGGLLGCGDRVEFQPGTECDLTSECATPLVCRLGHCRIECRQTRDCRAGLTCVRDEAGLGACQLPDEKDCALDSDCESPLVCRQAECTNVCIDDRDCPPGAICDVDPDTGERGCRDPAFDDCVLNSDCAEPLICAVDHQCREECVSDRDCRDGTSCDQTSSPRTCRLPVTPPMDAAPDTPLRDTGVDAGMDAGMDAGVDGGMGGGGDTGATDAGEADAGPMDSGAMDAGAMDAGAGDTGVLDTGILDTGVLDTGAMDAGTDGGGGVVSPGGPSLFVSGTDHVCVVEPTGLYCWGSNDNGQLGDGTTTQRLVPVSIALDGVRRMSAWNDHTCAITDTGLYCWGLNDRGQLGVGLAPATSTTPLLVPGVTASDISAGRRHTCALTAGGVQCWGANDVGQLGDGTTTDRSAPTAVPGLAGEVVQLAARSTHTCALLADGRAQCWGENNFGQLGNGGKLAAGVATPTPTLVSGLAGAQALYSGSSSVCAVDALGTASCWGDNVLGQLGDGTYTERLAPTVTLFADVVEMALGTLHACALHSDGGVSCAGDNTFGELGQDPASVFDATTPVAVSALGAATELAAGDVHTCARVGADAYCWGEGRGGQLGDGTTSSSFTPVRAMLP